MRLAYLVGARPNLVKMAPVVGEARRRLDGSHVLIHTGQHYDSVMSDVFFEELGVPEPDYVLGVGSGTHAVQTARAMERLEPVLIDERPDLLIVPGDVNSTLAGALVAAKLAIPFAHLEAGLRSFDRSMPEEVNRIVADEFADLLFVTCEDAIGNLAAEGIDSRRIHFVGNTMIDTLVALQPRIAESDAAERLGVSPGDYVLVTLHRPALVDGPLLGEAVAELGKLARTLPVVLPAHPRTAKRLETLDVPPGLVVTEPLGYLDFLSLEASAGAVLTDSGGVQEETTFLGVPCFTLRDNTERPVTITAGTNTLLGLAPRRISDVAGLLREKGARPAAPPPLWDGRAAERVVDVLAATLL